jgi:hypothetical protein
VRVRLEIRVGQIGYSRLSSIELDDVDALRRVTRDVSEATGRQYTLRIKSLLTYAHELGYTHFNANGHLCLLTPERIEIPGSRDETVSMTS